MIHRLVWLEAEDQIRMKGPERFQKNVQRFDVDPRSRPGRGIPAGLVNHMLPPDASRSGNRDVIRNRLFWSRARARRSGPQGGVSFRMILQRGEEFNGSSSRAIESKI